jgi:CRP/FNR family transcriptional regulator, cyclic AMP receptor protein
MMPMRAVLDYCTGGVDREVPAGTILIHEGRQDRASLCPGRLEVIKGDSVVGRVPINRA